MTLILDAAALVAVADRNDSAQSTVENVLRAERGGLILPAQVSAEVDYLLGVRLGSAARRAFLDDLAAERFQVECPRPDEYRVIAELDRAYAALDLGLADASIVVLAHRFHTRRLLTFDERHFRAVRPLQGGSFTLLPRDRASRP